MFGKRTSETPWLAGEDDARRRDPPRLGDMRPGSEPPHPDFRPEPPRTDGDFLRGPAPHPTPEAAPQSPGRSLVVSHAQPQARGKNTRSAGDMRTGANAVEAHPYYGAVFQTVFDTIDLDQLNAMSARRAREELRDLVAEIDAAQGLALSPEDQDAIAEAIGDDLVGLGPLEALVARGDVEEVRVTAPDLIYVEVNGRRRKAALRFRDMAQLAHVCRRLAARAGRTLDAENPVCDVRLPDGAQVTAILPPASASPVLRLRRPHVCSASLDTLTREGVMGRETADILSLAVRARCNILVIAPGGRAQGGVAASHLLSALAHEMDPVETLAVVEDIRRLTVPQPHAVRLTAEGGVTQSALRRRLSVVRAATRLGTDRLIVDPVSGPETVDILQAMAGGHRGSLASLHAVDARAALARLESLAAASLGSGAVSVQGAALRALIAGALDLVVDVRLEANGGPYVARVSELAFHGDQLALRDVLAPVRQEPNDAAGPLKFVAQGRPGFWSRVAHTPLEQDFIEALRAAR